MQIVSILGSHRKNGNTAAILRLVEGHLQALASANAEPLTVDRINISEVKINPCRGCRLCFDRGENFCPHRDDLLSIKARLDAADAIICGSPVYVADLSGSLKTLIDRLAFVCHRPAFYGKSVYLIASSGGSPVLGTIRSMAGAFLSMGTNLLGWRGFMMGACMPADEVIEKFEKITQKIAGKVFMAVWKGKALRPSLVSLIMFRVQQATWSRADRDSVDYQYWYKQGWTDPKTNFFIPNHANIFSNATARLIGRAISLFWRPPKN